ncbi:MAG TPA: cell division protein ZipA C-terminal FtsZ-binding domain-containing protein [Steroidobacteraceae bacterium]|nr:cell division protein ZipA C-terminal FtsZ-binding domain-containing protein [Steroidobacteraceae bacterium]
MPELRVTLMVVGGIFLIALAWWELRRSRQVRGSELPRPAPEPPPRAPERSSDWDLPPLDLPRMSARDPEAELPVVEVPAADFAALEARAEASAANGIDGLLSELAGNQAPDPPMGEEPWTEPAAAAAPEPVPAPLAATLSSPAVPGAAVVVDWPAAQDSQVLAVRLVSMGEKFSGRAVRMALAAEGFVLGKFSIFHKPAPDGRALLSIASLNKPGTFDLHSIDLQRYGGLNLFTVLPGPMPGPDAVDELLVCAQVLSQRLRGTLQDETGQPLSPARTAVMRHTAAAAPP